MKKTDSEWIADRVKKGMKGTQIFFLSIVFVIGWFALQVVGLSGIMAFIVLVIVGSLIIMAKK